MKKDIVIKAENLGKKYKIGKKQSYLTLRDQLITFPQRIFRKQKTKEFWALKDVNFEVKQGEVVGVIGKNGAGKSTLLKILSRIVEPTEGKITMKGKVSSLLEVGTGFNQELTGRENIYLNGAILGLSRKEIDNKYNDIVEFSGVKKFLYTPVKKYSSGMYVRLAFAVAAHLDSDILLIDEVLAVGDTEFQKKCLKKIDEVTKGGKTIMFVSHNLDSIKNLCSNTMLISEGKIVKFGQTNDVLQTYLKSGEVLLSSKKWSDIRRAPGNELLRLLEVKVHDKNYSTTDTFDIREKIGISIKYKVLKRGIVFTHGLNLYNEQGVNILNSHDITSQFRLKQRKKGDYISTVWIPGNFLSNGVVSVGVALFRQNPFEVFLHQQDAISFNVVDSFQKDSARGDYRGGFPGIVRPILHWSTKDF